MKQKKGSTVTLYIDDPQEKDELVLTYPGTVSLRHLHAALVKRYGRAGRTTYDHALSCPVWEFCREGVITSVTVEGDMVSARHGYRLS